MARPLVFADFGQGASWVGAARDVVDTLDHAVNDCALWSSGVEVCDAGDFCFQTEISHSSSGGVVTVTTAVDPGSGGPCVCLGNPAALNELDETNEPGLPTSCYPTDASGQFGEVAYNAHDGNAMLVHYGGALGPARVRWSLVPADVEGLETRDLSGYTHIGLRVANLVAHHPEVPSFPTPTSGADCGAMDPSYEPDEVALQAYLEAEDGTLYLVDLDVKVESDERYYGSSCRSAQFMSSARISLPALCEAGGVSIGNVRAIVLEFPEDTDAHLAMVDSIELLTDPAGAALAPTCDSNPPEACPDAPPSGWNCIASIALVATETSCSGEPTSGECDVGDVEQNVVPLPEIDDGQSGTFFGWVVDVPKGWIRDPQDPTEDELDAILAERCVAACELEYEDDPFVSATCSVGAFLEPTLRATSSTGARISIPEAYAEGSGLFQGESVECDLRDGCSAAFDENVGPSRMRRVSPAGEPLHRGEEWLVAAVGQIHADSTYAANPGAADIEAVVGYSRCAAGNDSTCPFYLGSMELDLLEPLALELECDSVPQEHELTALSIRLVQPAFGVAEQSTTWNGFPPGGLVLEAEGVVDEIPFTSRRPIEQPVYIDAADGLLWFQGLHGFKLDFAVPCNGVLADVEVWWELEDDAVLEGPPTLGIDNLPSTIACPDALALTVGWTNDPESDYASLRWVVDGVLLEETWPTIPFTETHEITAILRDSRGATGTATKTVFCE